MITPPRVDPPTRCAVKILHIDKVSGRDYRSKRSYKIAMLRRFGSVDGRDHVRGTGQAESTRHHGPRRPSGRSTAGGRFSSKDGLRDVLLGDDVPYRRGGEVAISDWHSGGYRMAVGKARTVFCAEGGK